MRSTLTVTQTPPQPKLTPPFPLRSHTVTGASGAVAVVTAPLVARHGVAHKNENFITFNREHGWDVKELIEKKEQCASFGIEMEMVALPMAGLHIGGEAVPHFMQGNYEEGDKEIELVINMVRQAAEAGIPAIKYYLCALENQRTESVPLGRGLTLCRRSDSSEHSASALLDPREGIRGRELATADPRSRASAIFGP